MVITSATNAMGAGTTLLKMADLSKVRVRALVNSVPSGPTDQVSITPGDNQRPTIVRSTIDLAHNLGKQVCAEGVENEETWKMLGELGCDLAQGYWISKPVPGPKLIEWLVETGWGLSVAKRSSQSAAR